ncbi:tetratricopeptide repeat-containing S1 family peptidase [Anabaena lutea]|uniref:Serine protease n=1 Tax=Anabaena lutea FACHB-196 TaxID=2692881 RepID=A0ABR8F966_9NOST|nr:tetratricopeptide repeat-containing serine protease family protein [Anabaena lutea]MBD2566757.1 serine protease [Anabaena lutea FACHB-196]
MNTSFERAKQAVVRIFTYKGTVVGTGFLVHENYVITCAHVVAQALGINADSKTRPHEDIFLDFPLIKSDVKLTANVVLWRPIPPKGDTSVTGKEDIAVLKLNNPPPANVKPVKLFVETNLRGDEFLTFGFPLNHDDGLEASGKLGGKQAAGWVQIEGGEVGTRLEPGFSGAPVWDEQLQGIVGMAVAADERRKEAKIGFMIPVEEIVRVWPALGKLTHPQLSLDKRKNLKLRFLVSLVLFPVFSIAVFYFISNWVSNPNCFEKAHREGRKAIAIFDFHTSSGNSALSPLLESQIQQNLQSSPLMNTKVCYIKTHTSPPNNAEDAQKQVSQADVVIWGTRGGSTIQVFVTTVKLKPIKYLSKLSLSTANSDLQTEDWQYLVSIITAYNLSRIYVDQGNFSEATQLLSLALTEQQNITDFDLKKPENRQYLAEAYYWLGWWYEHEGKINCLIDKDSCHKALAAYKEASKFSPQDFTFWINQALILTNMENLSEAIKIYTYIITSKFAEEDKLTAMINRGNLYLQEEKFPQAISDLTIACNQMSPSLNCLRSLGLAQLQAKKFPDANRTYKIIIAEISSNSHNKAEIINELKTLAAKKPQLAININQIINTTQ